MSCIHYKFKSSIDYNSVTFDGLHLSLADLKKAISAQKRLKPGEFDLDITNAQTGDVYQKTDELIAKNTSVIVSRVPVTKTTASSTQKSWEAFKQKCAKVVRVKLKEQERQMNLEKLKQAPDLASSQASEIDKIKAVIDLSTKGFEPSSLPGRHPLAVPSDSYVCKRCGKKGHFFTHCPNMKAEDRIIEPRVKRTTGIPSTMLTIVDDPLHPGALLTSRGQFAVPKVDAEAYRESKKERPPFLPDETNAEPEKKKIPQELLCHICEDLCVDAAIAPCCGTSFCDECLREVLLESDDHQCPSCHETNVSPDRIVANRSMRIAVTNFLNDTGYTKMRRRRSSSAGGDKAPAQEVENPVVPQNTLNANTLMISSNTIMSSSEVAIHTGASIQSTNISSTSTTSMGEVPHPTHSATYQPPRGHPRPPGFSGAYHNYPPPHHHPSSQGYPPRYWPRHKDPPGHHGVIRGDGPRHPRPNKYMSVDKNSWNMKPTASLVTTLVPNIAAVASQAVQAAQAALLCRGHPVMNVPPPTHMPFTALPGYPQNYVRPDIPHSNVIPVQASYVPPVEPPKPLSEEDFYKTQKLMQSSGLPKKSVDVFDSFADLTKMRSPTPELRSRSTSPTGTPPRKKSRSRSISPLSHHSLSRALSPRRIRTRSRSHSRPRSLLRSRSRSRQKSQLSPSQLHLKNRSRTRSPVQSHHSKVHSNSLSPLRRSTLRSRSRSPNRLSKAHSRSLSPLPPLKRSSKSPTSLRSRSRSRSFKRSLRTRSRSWSRPRRSRSRTYSPLPRSPKRSSWRSPRRSPRSSLSLRRSYSPRRRSRSYSPKRKSPYRSRTRSPPIRKRYSRSGSRSPRPYRRSFSPVGARRSKSPYRRPLSPLPQKRRSPSPFYGGGGGYKGRGRGRGGFNRDGFRSDREKPRHYPSPPRHPNTNTNTAPSRPPPDAPSHFPPVPYLPSMGLPPPEEYFKYNPAGYEEFVRNFYAQVGSQPPAWNAQQGTIPPPPINHYPPGQAPAPPDQPVNRMPWDAVNMPPAQRAHQSYAPPGMVANPGDFNHSNNNRPILNERDRNREEMGRDRRMDERRFDDRDRRGDSRERRFHNKDRRVDSRDRRMDDRERRFEDRDRRMDDKERRGDRDKGRDVERRRDFDRNKEKDKPRESRRSRDKISSEKKRSPQRRNSKEADRNKAKEKKKVDKNKEGKDKAKSKSKIEKGDTEDIHTPKDTYDEIRKEAVHHEKDTSELDSKPSMSDRLKPERESDIKSEENVSKTAEIATSDINKPPSDVDLSNVKEKKVASKKKTGAVGLKKMKGKDSASDSAAPGEKKGKKTKKKKLTFGSSDVDNKQGLKKKKLKRLVDYKSENNCLSEDGDHEKAGGVSPLKKSKVEDGDAPSSGQDSKAEKDLEAPMADIKSETSLAHSKDAGSPIHADTGDVKGTEKTLEKVKTDLIPELPELSKWERDDFDLLDTLEAPKEKPKEKLMVPRSIVDKAEKFLSQKPMKNSVVALATSASNKSEDETVPPKHRRSRSKSPVPKPTRKVYMDSRKDFKEKKSMDLQITVKGDKRKNESTSKKISLSSHKSNEDSFRRSHYYHSKDLDYEEDERSVVKSSSLERELKDDRSPVYRDRKGGSRQERTTRDRHTKYDSSKKDQDRHHGKPKEKSPPSRKTNRARHPSKEEKESKGSFVKSSKDLRARIEEKTKAKSSVESRKMSVMDESEFVPDYEDLGPDSTSDNEHTSQMSAASSHDEKEIRKRKNDDQDEGEDLSSGKHKKAKKKHKHKEKKEKKEKHKHKKKKHKQKKSKSKERDDD